MSANAPLSTISNQTVTSGSAEGERVALARDLSDLLMEISLALGHQSAYPDGHPMLITGAERLTHTLGAVLASRDTLTLGIASRQFVINGVTTDPRSEFLAKLAQRFHRHRIAAVRFDRGITHHEVAALLGALSTDPRKQPGPLGLQPEVARRWEHAQMFPARYEGLEIRKDADAPSDGESSPAVQLWLEMAHAALPEATGNEAGNSGNPAVLAAAINQHGRDATYDETVIGYLLQMAEEVAVGESAEQTWLRRRLSSLISALDPAALQRMMEMTGTDLQRRKFVLDASETLAADAVLKVVEAAAGASRGTISHNLMLLMGKLAHHAQAEAPQVASAAGAALRDNVSQLVAGWTLEDPNPAAYGSVLHQMAQTAPAEVINRLEFDLSTEATLQIGLEIGESGPRVIAAGEQLLAENRTRLLIDLLEGAPAPNPAADRLWKHLITPELLRRELAARAVDFAMVEKLALRLGRDATDPLLDALASADDRSARWNLVRILISLGPAVAPVVAARLPGAPWFVQRNLLVLLGRLGNWPAEFSPIQYTRHQEARVRREAYRLLVEDAATRDLAIREGLSDSDKGIVAMMLRAASTQCPPEAMSLVIRVLNDQTSTLEARLLAVRVVAVSRRPETVPHLLQLIQGGRRWWWGARLAPKSPLVLAALKALAEAWADHPEVRPLLTNAAHHRDPEIRAASGEVSAP
jgi:hypothetical protein